ncbi:MAG: hypothetical protein LBG19_01660 [Prevotellaceae bacterium]|jgi:hypothetical protein|nr:hypothetical protein [Prevotellaceae bacterium]
MSIKKILLGKGTILLALLLAYNNTLLAQDTEFWFVAPDVDEIYATGKCDDPARVILTAGDKPAVVLIKYKGGDKQILLTLTAGETKLVTFARTPAAGQYALADIENRPANSTTTKNKFGIQVTSDNPIYASYMADGPCLKDLFTLKGGGALGKEFFLSFQNKYPFTTTSYPNSRRSFHIVATEDNTNIAINLKNSTLQYYLKHIIKCGRNTGGSR